MRTPVLAAAAALLWAAPANAKELLGAQLCGAAGCATQRAAGLLEGHGGPLGDGEVAAPSKPGPWYRGYLLLGDQRKVFGKFAFYYVPDGDVVVQPGEGGQATTWLHPSPRLASLLAELAARVKPHPMQKLTEVAVNGRHAADPASYLKLYSVGKKATTYPTDIGTQISLQTDVRTPWSDGNDVTVYPSTDLLVRPTARSSRSPARSPTGPRVATAWTWAAAGCRGRGSPSSPERSRPRSPSSRCCGGRAWPRSRSSWPEQVEEGLDAYRTFRREQGDFEALFRAHYGEIVRYLTARLGSRDDALELASEVFTEAAGPRPAVVRTARRSRPARCAGSARRTATGQRATP